MEVLNVIVAVAFAIGICEYINSQINKEKYYGN